MKKNWYSALNYTKYALVLLLVGSLLIGIGSIEVKNITLSYILYACKYMGGLMKALFPLALAIDYIGTKHQNGIAVIAVIVSYLIIDTITMFMCDSTYPSYCYGSPIGMSISLTNASSTIISKQPLNLGLFASLAIILIVDTLYKFSRKRYNYGYLTFIDNDAWFFLLVLVASIIVGLVAVFTYGELIDFVLTILKKISTHTSNPAVMFCYGIFDRISRLTFMDNLLTNTFWVGELGGSWIDSANNVYIGDFPVWNAQYLASSIASGTGKYTTPYYWINLFAIPSICIGTWLNITDKMDRKRLGGLVLLALMASIISGSSLPVELTLLFIAPTLLVIHIILSGFMYMFSVVFGVYLGYGFTGNPLYAIPGNIVNFIKYYISLDTRTTTFIVLIIGIFIFAIYILILFVYYHLLAQDFLDSEAGRVERRKIVECLGGLENIKMLTSSATSFTVVLNNEDKIDVEKLKETRAYKITERYFGYIIQYGPGATSLVKQINKEIKAYNDCLEYHKG